MYKSRCYHETLAQIMTMAKKGVPNVTAIFYEAKLSGRSYTKFTNLLVQRGLLEQLAGGNYKTTKKGLLFRRRFNQLQRMIGVQK